MAKISKFDLDAIPSSSGSYIATWAFTGQHLDHFVVQWQYYTFTSDVKYNSKGKLVKEYVWVDGNKSDIKIRQATYSPPENASKIRVRVKPVSTKTKKVGSSKKQRYEYWWTGTWSDWKEKNVTDNSFVPVIPSIPTLTSDRTKVKIEVNGLDSNVDSIIFEYVNIYGKRKTTGFKTVKKSYGSASWTLNGAAGHIYKARAKSRNIVNKTINKKKVQYQYDSDFSAWSGECSTIPETPNGLTVNANSVSSVIARWNSTSGAKTYIVGYARSIAELKNMSGSYSSTQTSENATSINISGLESGHSYYFRVASINENNRSEWSPIVSVILGVKPNPPTIWSSTTIAKKGESVNLYFLHNSADGSAMRAYKINILVNDESYKVVTDTNKNYDDYGEPIDKTNVYSLDTNSLSDGDVITWNVQTKGVYPDYSEYSAPKSINVCEQPHISLGLYLGEDYENPLTTVKCFPLHIHGDTSPLTQKLINYNISIISNDDYESGYDEYGDVFNVNEGDEIFSKSYNANDENEIDAILNPGDVDLENGIEYTIKCTGSFDSGLTAESSIIFNVSWEDEHYILDGVVEYNSEDISASIRPTCRLSYPDDIEEFISETDTEYFPGDVIVEDSTGIKSAQYINSDSKLTKGCTKIKSRLHVQHSFNCINIALDTNIISKETLYATDCHIIYKCVIVRCSDMEPLAESENIEKIFSILQTPEDGRYLKSQYIGFNFMFNKVIPAGEDVYVSIECWRKPDYIVEFTPTIYYRFYPDDFKNSTMVPFVDFNVIYTYVTNDANGTVIATEQVSGLNQTLAFKTCYITSDADASLAVYRRTANGKFIEIESGITNLYSHTVTDPHPSLDNARYRIAATSNITGAISYVDLPSYPIPESSIIIQWNEQWRSYDSDFEGDIPSGNKSILKLPYNIDVSESNSKDVNLINYIGRERPVGYYGTQLGETSNWNCEIPKSDVETLYQLRRLAAYMGNVYVREPSGLGYWAKIDVSLSQTHCELTIPATLNVTPVEGGM